MVLRANRAVIRMPCAPFVILPSPVEVCLGRLLIFLALVERFSVKSKQIFEHVCQCIEKMIIGMHDSKQRR
jgi:hypothetical protein